MNMFVPLMIVSTLIFSSVRSDISDLPPPPPVVMPVVDAAPVPVENVVATDIPSAKLPTLPIEPLVSPAIAPAVVTPPATTDVSSVIAAPVASVTPETAVAPVQAMSLPAAPVAGYDTTQSVPVAPVASGTAEPLFAQTTSDQAAQPTSSSKDMYEKTISDRDTAQAALTSLEKAKSDSMDSYLAFDKELDDLYDAAGVARGTALADLADAKQHIIDAGDATHGVDNAAQSVVDGQAKLLDTLSKELEAVQSSEGTIVAALKVVSDYVIGFSDDIDSIGAHRSSLMNATDASVINDLVQKIKQSADKIVAAEKSSVLPGGQIRAYTDALTAGKEKIASVKKILEEIKQKNINITELVAKVAAQLDAKSHAEKEGDDEPKSDKKKSKKTTRSSLEQMVKGTVFESPYTVLASLWDFIAPVRLMVVDGVTTIYAFIKPYISDDNNHDDGAGDDSTPLTDPVLERIRIERTQSHKKVKSLEMQREVIEMKSTLLDRLEAERIMQLDKKEELKSEISRAYARKDRELSWIDLFKRIFWKLYATVRRLALSIITWWNGEEPVSNSAPVAKKIYKDGVGEPKLGVDFSSSPVQSSNTPAVAK